MYMSMIDTMIFSIDTKDYDNDAKKIKEELEVKKAQAKIVQVENQSRIISIKIGDMTFEVLPNGKKGYAYILHNDLYEIDLAQYRSKNEEFYPILIKIKSEALWSMGPGEAWKNVYLWTNKYIGEIKADKISRIDLCCHTDKLQLNENDLDKFKGQYYTNCVHYYRRKVNAITFGSSASGKIYCRIYDKVLEIKQKKMKKWFFDIWKKNGFNCNKVWNIEFQICREFLKEHGINTVEEASQYVSIIWEYCTKKWLVKIIRDNENITRCSIDPVWKIIQSVFQKINNKSLIKREKQLNEDAESIIPSIYGYITTFAAKKDINDLKLTLQLITVHGERYLKSKKMDFKKVVSKKRALVDKEKKKQKTYYAETFEKALEKNIPYAGVTIEE